MIEVKFEDYVRNLRANAHSAVVLAGRLEKAFPSDGTPDEKKALRVVSASAAHVRDVRSERERLAPPKLRPLLDPYINDWSALYGSLSSLAKVSGTVSKSGPAAKKIVDTLFVDGIAFVRASAERAWEEGDRLLRRMEQEKLTDEIGELVGAHFIVGVRKSTRALGEAIGIGKNAKPIPSSTGLIEALADFGRAVGQYGRVMAASVDQTNDASVTRFLEAMEPIDLHRAAAIKGGSSEDDEIDPAAPTQPSAPAVTPSPSPAPTRSPANPDPEVVG